MPIDIAAVKECIEKNLKHIHTVEDIASKLSVSAETLKKDFARHELLGISKYIMTIRVERMQERLKNSDDKCLVICVDLGLREDSGAKLFKKLTGITMDEFRRQHKNGHRYKQKDEHH